MLSFSPLALRIMLCRIVGAVVLFGGGVSCVWGQEPIGSPAAVGADPLAPVVMTPEQAAASSSAIGNSGAVGKERAPPAREVLRRCDDALFIECFRKWQWEPSPPSQGGQGGAPSKNEGPDDDDSVDPDASSQDSPANASNTPNPGASSTNSPSSLPANNSEITPSSSQNPTGAVQGPASAVESPSSAPSSGTDAAKNNAPSSGAPESPGEGGAPNNAPQSRGDEKPGVSQEGANSPQKSASAVASTAVPLPLPSGVDPRDLATYESLAKAIKELGLEKRLQLGGPPTDDSAVLTVNKKPSRASRK
ncbi:hypothetical protein CCP2SC5_380005 [Azospirillaceae bacterium]